MEKDQGTPPSGGVIPRTSFSKKAEEKHRKRDPKSWENVSKAMAGMDEPSKINHLEKMYQELYKEFRYYKQQFQQLVKQNAAKEKEIDHNQSELAKSVVARSRLENLCRELQKQNKQIKEENMAKIKEEEERRKEVSLKFADKLADINNMMGENKEKSDKLREENLKMTAKFSELYHEFQQREQDITKLSKQLELERQYSQASLSKLELEIQAEKELNAREQAMLKSNLEKSEANCSALLDTIKGLQDHVEVYKDQYEDFESTMEKSARVFDSFKAEIASMTKQISGLEQESLSWQHKFNDSMKALVEVNETKKSLEVYLLSLDKKNDKLRKLCRQLQVERSHYLKLLKDHGIDPPAPSPSKEKTPDEQSTSKMNTNTKLTKKEKELQILKNNLKAVQDQLTQINVEENKTDNKTSQTVMGGSSAKGAIEPPEEHVLQLVGQKTKDSQALVNHEPETQILVMASPESPTPEGEEEIILSPPQDEDDDDATAGVTARVD